MDTSRDYRILMAEDAIHRLENIVNQWRLPYKISKGKALDLLRSIRSSIMSIKYSFLPLSLLIKLEVFESLRKNVLELANNLLPPHSFKPASVKQQLILSEIKYSLWVLAGLKHRFLRGEDNLPEYAVDIIGVEVFSVSDHPGMNNLKILRCGSEKYVFTVITNLKNIHRGEIRGVAILPPVEFGGVISEAMIATNTLSSNFKGKLVPYNLVNINEVRAKVLNIIPSK
jgi:predicted RNA-binding protein with EMAP domain